MTTFTFHDLRYDVFYTIYHNHGEFVGALSRPSGAIDATHSYDSMSELPLHVRTKIESMLCQQTK